MTNANLPCMLLLVHAGEKIKYKIVKMIRIIIITLQCLMDGTIWIIFKLRSNIVDLLYHAHNSIK